MTLCAIRHADRHALLQMTELSRPRETSPFQALSSSRCRLRALARRRRFISSLPASASSTFASTMLDGPSCALRPHTLPALTGWRFSISHYFAYLYYGALSLRFHRQPLGLPDTAASARFNSHALHARPAEAEILARCTIDSSPFRQRAAPGVGQMLLHHAPGEFSLLPTRRAAIEHSAKLLAQGAFAVSASTTKRAG